MKCNMFVDSVLLIATLTGLGQPSPNMRNIFVEGFDDIGKIKLQAEQGDASAQIKLADAYLSHNRSADALKWYSAAAQKSVEAQCQLGKLLLFGRWGIPQEQRVAAKPTEGLRWTYLAATSGHREARRNMAKALTAGVGCSTNLVEAYAWLTLLADAGDIVGRVEMNDLALKLQPEEIARGKSLAAETKTGRWPPLPAIRVPVTLKLTGVIVSPKGNQAIINNQTMREGETVDFKVDGQKVAVTCKNIQADSVQVQVEGEDHPRVLRRITR